jgi:hypothetical protein
LFPSSLPFPSQPPSPLPRPPTQAPTHTFPGRTPPPPRRPQRKSRLPPTHCPSSPRPPAPALPLVRRQGPDPPHRAVTAPAQQPRQAAGRRRARRHHGQRQPGHAELVPQPGGQCHGG